VDCPRCGRDDGRSQGCVTDLAGGDRRRAADEAMSTVDRLADRLEAVSEKEAAKGGFHVKLAEELADDAAFIRKLKPSLIKARAKGELPTNERPGGARRAPAAAQLGSRPAPGQGDGPNPWLVVGVALVGGIVLAKLIDWRGHAHPRD
jgi:hypothetical protein